MTAAEFDYIIIGAGSAGCVLAKRLAEHSAARIGLFEAGKSNRRWTIDMPAALTYNLEHDKYNWFYHTTEQTQLNNRRLYWPRGKVLGGSSSLNAMVYIRGHAFDYDRWHQQGAANWDYAHVLPYFKRAESYDQGEDDYRGGHGPLHVTRGATKNPLFDAFISAGQQAGHPYTADMNGYQQYGFGRMDMTIKRGKRHSTARAYLQDGSLSHNVNIHCEALITKIIIEKQKAIGIEYLQQGQLKKAFASREVILSGGAINSPQLLMLSGIGPADELQKHRIKPLVNLPGVGQNLQDHLEIYIQQACLKPITLYAMNNPLRKMFTGIQWFCHHSGLAASSQLEAGGFIYTDTDVTHPDIQYHFLPGMVNDHGRDAGQCHAYQVHVGPMRPTSRGYLTLKNNDPLTPPLMEANYLQTEQDKKDMRKTIHLTRDIFAQAALSPFRGEEIRPGKDCRSDKEIDAFIREKADSAYHPCGTCKMGVDEHAVVDPSGRVYGIDHLRVVDASIMPSMVSGNLNAPTIMLAERFADIILDKPLLEGTKVPVYEEQQASALKGDKEVTNA